MTEALDLDEFYRTDDMALVTSLKMEGHSHQAIIWEGDTCYWIFRISDALLEHAENFFDGAVTVDPREYTKVYARTKREFFDSQGGGRR